MIENIILKKFLKGTFLSPFKPVQRKEPKLKKEIITSYFLLFTAQ